VRQVLVGDARPLVPDGQHAVSEGRRDGAARRAPLGSVVEQVGDGAFEALRVTPHQPGPCVRDEADGRRASRHPLDSTAHDVGQVDGLHRCGVAHQLVGAGQLDQVTDQVAQLGHLGPDVGYQLGPLHPPEPCAGLALRQQVEVGAQAGQGSAQLVARVGDEGALTVPRPGQGRQHGVERRGEPGDLVAALHLDRVEPLGGRDVLGRQRQPLHGAQAGAGDHQPCVCGKSHSCSADEQQDQPQPAKGLLRLRRRLGQDEGKAARHRYGDHPEVITAGRDRANGLLLLTAGDRELGGAERRRVEGPLGGERLPVAAAQQRDPQVCRRPQGCAGDARQCAGVTERGLHRCARAGQQRVVAALLELAEHRGVRRHRDEQDSKADTEGRQHADPGAQGQPAEGPLCPAYEVVSLVRRPRHGGVSRREYPTPRTVCSSRGSSPASVLRRR
jgi:hypothetical protein